MNTPLAATLFYLCSHGCALAAAEAAPLAPVTATREAAGMSAREPTPGAGHAPALARPAARTQPPAAQHRSPARERGLLLAGFALMAGITLRRLGDGSP